MKIPQTEDNKSTFHQTKQTNIWVQHLKVVLLV